MDLASRARIAKNIDHIREWQRHALEVKESGQADLFASPAGPPPLELEDAETWTEEKALQAEYEALGFYLSGHPTQKFHDAVDWAREYVRNKNGKSEKT